MNYYIDTCIWIDYWENRIDGIRPLGEFAFKFLTSIEDSDIILFSDIVIDELKRRYSDNTIVELFSIIPQKQLIKIYYTGVELSLAAEIVREKFIPFADAMHRVLSDKYYALLITRDAHLLDFSNAMKPEDL